MRGLVLTIAMASASSVLAQEAPDYAADVESCFATARKDGNLACIGDASDHCQKVKEGGASTLGIVDCNGLEAEAWDTILNREYYAALAYAAMLDSDDPSAAGNVVEIVKKAERAWLEFRDAECLMAYAGWGGGSMRNIASSSCNLRMSAERALALRSWYHLEPEE